MMTQAQSQRFDFNRSHQNPIHYHGYQVQSVQYHRLYRAGSETLYWQCKISLPYQDVSSSAILADARSLWAGCEIMQAICGVSHVGMIATVVIRNQAHSMTIVDLSQGPTGMVLTLECAPASNSVLWTLSAHDIQTWLDHNAQTDR